MVRWIDNNMGMSIIVAFLIMLTVLGLLFMDVSANQSRLMKACMDDGHKEYECVSMLRMGRR